jgi:hypothetical protein
MNRIRTLACLTLLTWLASAGSALAQEPAKKDESGTNPTNFTYDFRIWNEAQDLPGDNSFTKTTFEYRFPVGKKFAFRTRIPYAQLSLDGAGSTTGLADIDARFIYLAHANRSWALAFGLEGTFDTATKEILGSGKTTIGPQVFVVKFAPLGIKGALIAPAYQYVTDVAGDDDRADIRRSLIDIFFVWLAGDKKHWAVIDPQIVIDHEAETETLILETEVGQMMFGPTSSYIRPGFHLAGDELYNWNVEAGFKVIWK